MMNCCELPGYISSFPQTWRNELSELLCKIMTERQNIDCNNVKDCETVTVFNSFTLNDTFLNLSYINERGEITTRQVDLSSILNGNLTFNNGLIALGDTVQFGGDLLKNTEVNLSGFELSFVGNDYKFASFPNTRDDSGTVSPINFLYTDAVGKLQSASLDYLLDEIPNNAVPGLPYKSVQFNTNDTFDGSQYFIYDEAKSSLQLSNAGQNVAHDAVLDVTLNNANYEPFGLKVVNTSYVTKTAGEFYGVGFKAYNPISGVGTPGFIDLQGLRRNAANNADEWTSLVRWGRTGFGSDVANDERVWSFKGRTILSFNGTIGSSNLPVITYGVQLSNSTAGDAVALEITGRSATQSEVVVGPLYDGQTNLHVSRLILRAANVSAPFSEIIFRKGLTTQLGRWTNNGSFIVGWDTASIGNPATEITTAALQVESKTKGFLPPRMTQVERLAIPVNAQSVGLIVYQTNGVEGPYVYTSSGWRGFALV